jgi:hypothetical protein
LLSSAIDFVPRLGIHVDSNPVDEPAQARILHPFIGWEAVGGIEQLNAELTRIDNPEFDNDYEVLIVGGSVADMFGHFGVPTLQKMFEADPRLAGKRFYFYKYARGGFKQPQMLDMVNYLLGLGFTPNAVINIDGFNDVALATDNVARGTSAVYPSIPHWGALASNGMADRQALDFAVEGRSKQKELIATANRALDRHYEWSAWLSAITRSSLIRLKKESDAGYSAYVKAMRKGTAEIVLRGPRFESEIENSPVRRGALMWQQSSLSLHGLCQSRGIYYLHVLQPTLHDVGSKPLTADEQRTGAAADTWIDGVHKGYPLLRIAARGLIAKGENYLDATQVFAGIERTLYFDACHFGPDGNQVLATRIGEEFLKHLPAEH